MPISDEALQSEKNRFIAVKGEATVGQAIAALKALGGQLWWHLVVQIDDSSWGVAKFSDLVGSLEPTAVSAEIRLRDVKTLKIAPAVEQADIDQKAAQALARKSPAKVLVVTDKGAPVGILVERMWRGAAAKPSVLAGTSPNLDQLGGKYVKLKDYGSILLGCSKK